MAQTFAFITALNEYSVEHYGNIKPLKGCIKDAKRFLETFAPVIDVKAELYDQDATHAEIMASLKWFAGEMKAGDTLIWFHSGHGSYADIAKGRATCRCVFDGPFWDAAAVKAWKMFPKGVNIYTLSDTCYSESNSRFLLSEPTATAKAYVMERKPTKVPTVTRMTANVALVSISASTIEQTAMETERGGVFTNAIPTQSIIGGITWRELFKVISMNIPPIFPQTPILDWNASGKKNLDKMVFDTEEEL